VRYRSLGKVGDATLHSSLIATFDNHIIAKITGIHQLDPKDAEEIKARLANGHDIWFALRAANGIQHPTGKPGAMYIPDEEQGGHWSTVVQCCVLQCRR